ncbi:hypothetical protein ABPG72_002323 [Tetrahymena utriculariae]
MYNKNRKNNIFINKYFLEENIAKSSICIIIKHADQRIQPKRKQSSGRTTKIFPKNNYLHLQKYLITLMENCKNKLHKFIDFVNFISAKYQNTNIKRLKKKLKPAITDQLTDQQKGKIRGLCKNYFWITVLEIIYIPIIDQRVQRINLRGIINSINTILTISFSSCQIYVLVLVISIPISYKIAEIIFNFILFQFNLNHLTWSMTTKNTNSSNQASLISIYKANDIFF